MFKQTDTCRLSERDDTRLLPHLISVSISAGSLTFENYLKYISIWRYLTDVIVDRQSPWCLWLEYHTTVWS